METAYWRRRLQSGEQLSTEILVAAVQPMPMRIVGRSTGGLQLLCVSSENKLYLVMRIQERGWSVIGSPLSVQLGCMEDLYGVCFRSESIYIVLSSGCMAHIGIQAHFLGETCVWAEKAQVDDIKRSIDKRREDITSSLMETYSLDVSAQRFVDFVETSAVAEPGGGGMPFKGRPKFSKDCRVRSKRGKFLPAEEEGLCIGTLICILMEISPGKDIIESWSVGNRVIRVYAKTKAAVILRTWRHDMQTVGTQLRRWMQFIKILAKVTSLFRNLDALPAAIVSDTFDVTKKSKSWIEDRASRVSLFMQAWMQSGSMASEIFHLPSGSRDLPFSDFIRENIADLMQNNVDPLAQCRIGAKSLSIAATLDKCVTRLSGMQNLALSCMPSQTKESKMAAKRFNGVLQDVVAHVRNTQMVIQAATTLAEAIKRRRMCETGMQADVSRLVGLCRDQYEDIARVPELVSECIAEVQRLGMGDIQSAFARNAAWSTSEVDATFSPITCLERPLV